MSRFECPYCKNKFTRESTIYTHVCEQKRRNNAKSEKHVRLGYQTFIRFYELNQNCKTQKTYEEFAKSPYYNAFVHFGSFLSNVNPLYPNKYIDYIVKSGVKLEKWCDEELYYNYVLDYIKKESVDVALERSINTMLEWAEKNNSQWNHYFKYVSESRFIYDIKDGKISPWLILNSPTGRTMLSNLSDHQLKMICTVIEPEFWAKKFKKQKDDIALVNAVVQEGNL